MPTCGSAAADATLDCGRFHPPARTGSIRPNIMHQRDNSDRRLRQQHLLELLRQLAARIHATRGVTGMLAASAELDLLLGTATTEFADLDDSSRLPLPSDDHQRIVDEARQASSFFYQPGDDSPWRKPQAE